MNPAGQACGNCRFFDQEAVMGEAQGKCLRFPPAIGGNAWPTVNADRWCGEWKAIGGTDAATQPA